ncbi:MAG TPA: hypothetical protein VGB32_11300 [Candidatus Bathyarchaeia archaeon]
MMGLILAYSLLVIPPPLITRATTPETWSTQMDWRQEPIDHFKWVKVGEPDYDTSNQMVLEGDQVLEFRNQVVNFTDLVLVKDNAKIILRNSTLISPAFWETSSRNIFNDLAGILFNGSARLEAYDSVITPSRRFIPNPSLQLTFNMGFMGQSSCYLENTLIVNCTLNFDDSATLEAIESYIYGVNADRSSSLKIVDSYVSVLKQDNYWRSRWASPVKEVNASAYLEGSRVDFLMVRVVNSSSCQITGNVGEQSFWNIFDAFKIDGDTMNVTLRGDSIVELVWVYAINSRLNITGAEVYFVQARRSKVSMEDSQATSVLLYGDSSLTAKDSNIYSFVTESHSPYIEYLWDAPRARFHQNASITKTRIERMRLGAICRYNFSDVYVGDASIRGFESVLSGSVTWGQDDGYEYYLSPYERFAFTQVFEVNTQGQERVLPGVSLSLTDKDGNVVWEGASDESGEASFNLTFCQYYPLYEPYKYVTNYMDEWTLKAVYGDESRETSAALFKTGSPIVFEFTEDKPVLPVSNAALTYASVATLLLATALKLWKSLPKVLVMLVGKLWHGG